MDIKNEASQKMPFNYDEDENDDDDDKDEADVTEWMTIVFLPFHPVFRLVILLTVLIKITVSAIESLYPIIYCNDLMDTILVLSIIKFIYVYFCDTLYAIDTLLHILHRVTDIAKRREILPKSKFLIMLDIISLIPFYRLLMADTCAPTRFWPNVVGLIPFFQVYRIENYFSLKATHCYWDIFLGYTLIILVTTNLMTCLFILITGAIFNKSSNVYLNDWRKYIIKQINETDEARANYITSALFVSTYLMHQSFIDTRPEDMIEYHIAPLFMIISFVIYAFIAIPKSFEIALFNLRRTFEFFPRVQKIIADTKRRSSSPEAHIGVTKFYSLIWTKRAGITCIPDIIKEFPRYLRIDIKHDLAWPVFFHSPTLRRVSMPFKHWLCDYTHLDFKLPNENFYANPHCLSYMFYLKSGIVQLISAEDGITPLLSVTGGTLFGDINFFLPPASKSVIVRCLTFCEIYFFTRADIFKALHRFPEDRKNIFERIKNKVKHAKTLHNCKQHVRGLDRAEDEGVAWIERRWWELNEAISRCKNISTKVQTCCELPPEETIYHCSKYIGQLVLCPDDHLQRKSMFASYQFPWMLAPESTFNILWQQIVKCTVVLVLILYPSHLTLDDQPHYFFYFKAWANIIYIADICLSLLTAIEDQNHLLSDFSSVMLARCKSSTFIVNLLATVWIEDFVRIIGIPELYTVCQFNRLIKVYLVFFRHYKIKDIKTDPSAVISRPVLFKISFVYVTGFFFITLTKIVPNFKTCYFIPTYCSSAITSDSLTFRMINAAFWWALRNIYLDPWPDSLNEFYAGVIFDYISFFIGVYCGGQLIAVIYLKNRNTADYLIFASNTWHSFNTHFVHPGLWERVKKYIICYWKYNKELVMATYLLRYEPYDIYWKAHGEIAAKVISQSKAFTGANPSLIKELAHNARFIIFPRHSTIALTGVTVKDVSWLVNGVIIMKTRTENGVAETLMRGPDARLISCSLFFGKPSIATFTTSTECEILSISTIEFFRIINRYPLERLYIRSCTDTLKPSFRELLKIHLGAQIEYRWNETYKPSKAEQDLLTSDIEMKKYNWRNPKSKFTRYWMPIRAFFVVVSIISTSLQGGSGAAYRRVFVTISGISDCITLIDIVVKCFMAYYDHRGLLIYSKRMCLIYYLSHGFILDLIAIVPWSNLVELLCLQIETNTALLLNSLSKYARVHLMTGYFDYLTDTPVAPITVLKIVKWQIFIIMLLFTASQYLIIKCVTFEWNDKFNLVNVSKRDECWMPEILKFDKVPTEEQLKLLFCESFNLGQYSHVGLNYGLFILRHSDVVLGIVLFSLALVYWTVFCYMVAMLTLSRRSSTLFQHAFSSLSKFLYAERLDKKLIDRSLAHFNFWWRRTKGVNLNDTNLHKSMSSMFKNDLNYFFFRQTFVSLDTVLQGGEQMMKNLACVGLQYYLLANVPVMREMDLNPWVFVVHRGEVVISQEGKTLAILRKGSIFGQLTGTGHRPVRVSANTTQYTDVLRIPVIAFQGNIDDAVRLNISRHPDSAFDYIKLTDTPKENPYNTIQYLLKGGKTIQLPWMKELVKSHVNPRYGLWLGLVWVAAPFTSAAIVLILNTLPLNIIHHLLMVLIILDFLQIAHVVSEFYTLKLVVINDQCVYRHVKLMKFKEWQTYVDILSLILPLLTIFTHNWGYQLGRLLRLRYFYDFYGYYCQDYKRQGLRVLVDFLISAVIIHAVVCGWVVVACRPSVLVNSYYIPKEVPTILNHEGQWIEPEIRGEGCKTIVFLLNKTVAQGPQTILVPLRWQDDYAIALGFVVSFFTRSITATYASVTYSEVLFKCLSCFILNLVSVWISSLAIKAVYLEYRELLDFDYKVAKLFSYLKHNGLTNALMASVKQYTILLWQKQGGNWMPELVHEAPLCLKEDLYVALYSYHLHDIPLFRNLPNYFTRQLATRLQRVVLFPGKVILQVGEIFSCMYFIHEGEVEKWYTDASGEKRMLSLLTTNGFFGVIPGLFPDTAIQFTFVTRTVVDVVFLRHRDWQDLLEGYPDIKTDLYAAARQLKKDLLKT